MADSYTLKNNSSGDTFNLELKQGVLGPSALDISALYKERGVLSFDPGFVSTASCESAITYIDGEQGVLMYRGYPIEQLAAKSSFLEVAYLLIYGELPAPDELKKFE